MNRADHRTPADTASLRLATARAGALALLLIAAAQPAAAAEKKSTTSSGGGSHHAIGLDLVRLLDNGQFEPNDGVLNLFYQGYLTRNTGWRAAYAWGEQSKIWEVGYKIYNQGYQNGTFWEVGVTSIDVDGSVAPKYDGDIAVLGAFGFERTPAEHVVVSGAVKALVGVDHPHVRPPQKDIIFLPSLSVMFTF